VKMVANVVKDLGLDSFNWPGAAAFAMLALALTLALLTAAGRLTGSRAA
jgi:ABC-type spermidine/putrescine transport system permease subunit I